MAIERQMLAIPSIGCAATSPCPHCTATGLRLCGVLGRHALLATLLAVVHQLLNTCSRKDQTGAQQYTDSMSIQAHTEDMTCHMMPGSAQQWEYSYRTQSCRRGSQSGATCAPCELDQSLPALRSEKCGRQPLTGDKQQRGTVLGKAS
jgi:hypothetical protein